MKEQAYIELLKSQKYDELANIKFVCDLVEYKYDGKYLIEYLLEKGIHSNEMDNYLKYNIIEPLLNCYLVILLENNGLILDLLLDKLSDTNKINLYDNLKQSNYTIFLNNERKIIDIYLKHGIILPILFAKTKLETIPDTVVSADDLDLINEFVKTFFDQEKEILDFIINEFKIGLSTNHLRTVNDIKKWIQFKKENPTFKFIKSNNVHGNYDNNQKTMKLTSDSLVFEHEFSHLLYSYFDNDKSSITLYEQLREKIDTSENLKKIEAYLSKLHKLYEDLKIEYAKKYFLKVNQMYGNMENYIEKIYMDIKNYYLEFLEIKDIERDTISYVSINNLNMKEVIRDFLNMEKEEFISINARKAFSPYLMFENLLDAVFLGKIFDDLDFKCLSGHGVLYFLKDNNRSFNECLANYDAIKKSSKSDLIKELRSLIGDDIINLLDKYIEKNREESYGNR